MEEGKVLERERERERERKKVKEYILYFNGKMNTTLDEAWKEHEEEMQSKKKNREARKKRTP